MYWQVLVSFDIRNWKNLTSVLKNINDMELIFGMVILTLLFINFRSFQVVDHRERPVAIFASTWTQIDIKSTNFSTNLFHYTRWNNAVSGQGSTTENKMRRVSQHNCLNTCKTIKSTYEECILLNLLTFFLNKKNTHQQLFLKYVRNI